MTDKRYPSGEVGAQRGTRESACSGEGSRATDVRAILSSCKRSRRSHPPLSAGSDGVVRVSATRVSLETIVSAFDAGATAEEIVQQYPSLELAQVYAVISYILDNRRDVNAYVASRRDRARALQAQIESYLPPYGIRERLLARRDSARR
jgi:uncharacterized protein (DUF433 family)